jgi:hypothetical protein
VLSAQTGEPAIIGGGKGEFCALRFGAQLSQG